MSTAWNLTNTGPLGLWTPERTEKKKITPKTAEWLLEKCNVHNRAIVNSSVQRVEDALNNNTWKCTGQPIIFGWYPREVIDAFAAGDPDLERFVGRKWPAGTEYLAILIDGQNRLWGCVNAGKPLLSWVHFGQEDPTAFMATDRGKNRGNADDLSIFKEKYPKALSAVLTMLNTYDKGARSTSLIASPKVPTPELLVCLRRHPQVRESTHWAQTNRLKTLAPDRIVAFVHYLAGASDNPKVISKRDEFFDRFLDGAGLALDSPILAVRTRFILMAGAADVRVKRGMGSIANYTYLWCLVRAWNAHLMGHELTRMQMPFKDKTNKIPADIPDIRTYFRRPSETTKPITQLVDEAAAAKAPQA